jgi:hypothetical protein
MGGRRVVGRVVVLARAVLAVGPPGPVSARRVVRWPLRTRRLVLLLLAVGMLGVLAYGLANAATSVDLSVPSWSERSFSPNGDDQEDTATVSYCVSAAATVTASVTADDGSPVRTLEPAEVTAGFACNSWNNQVAWDGKLDCGLRSKT